MFQGWGMDWRGGEKEMKTKKIQGVRSGEKPKVSITFQPRLEDNPDGKNLGESVFQRCPGVVGVEQKSYFIDYCFLF